MKNIFLAVFVSGILLLSMAAISAQSERSDQKLKDLGAGEFRGPQNERMQIERGEKDHKNITLGDKNNSDFETDMNISLEQDDKNKTHLKVHFNNGMFSEVKVMPSTASEKALEVLGAKCEERNCTIELKEVGKGNETKAAYKVHAKKDVKVLGLFKAKMNVDADIDANTGEVIAEHKPWWSAISTN